MKLRRAVILALAFLMTGTAVVSIHGAQEPPVSVNYPLVLSETHGYDFTFYLNLLAIKVRAKWYETMPDAAKKGRKGKVLVTFTVLREGTIQDVRVVAGSGTQSLDEAATTAVQSVSPFLKLPDAFSGENIVVQFPFLYNQK